MYTRLDIVHRGMPTHCLEDDGEFLLSRVGGMEGGFLGSGSNRFGNLYSFEGWKKVLVLFAEKIDEDFLDEIVEKGSA